MSERVAFLGVEFDRVSVDQAVAGVLSDASASRGGIVLTPNVSILRRIEQERIRVSDWPVRWCLVDGMPVVWLLRLAGLGRWDRVAGSDLLGPLLTAAASAPLPVIVVASDAAAIADRLGVAGVEAPMREAFSAAEAVEIAARIPASATGIALLGLGFRKDADLGAALLVHRPGWVFVGVGQAVRWQAGLGRRAPMWMQRAGLEWLHRLGQEPGRLARRYLVQDLPWLIRTAWRIVRQRRRDTIRQIERGS